MNSFLTKLKRSVSEQTGLALQFFGIFFRLNPVSQKFFETFF